MGAIDGGRHHHVAIEIELVKLLCSHCPHLGLAKASLARNAPNCMSLALDTSSTRSQQPEIAWDRNFPYLSTRCLVRLIERTKVAAIARRSSEKPSRPPAATDTHERPLNGAHRLIVDLIVDGQFSGQKKSRRASNSRDFLGIYGGEIGTIRSLS